MYYQKQMCSLMEDPGATAPSKPRGAWPSGGAMVNQRPKDLQWNPPSSRDGVRINPILQPAVAEPRQQPAGPPPFALRPPATVTPRLDGQIRRAINPVQNAITKPVGLHYNPITLPQRSLSAPRQKSARTPSAAQRMPSQPAAAGRCGERTAPPARFEAATPSASTSLTLLERNALSARTGAVTPSAPTSLTGRSLYNTPVSTRAHGTPLRATPNTARGAVMKKPIRNSSELADAREQLFGKASARPSKTTTSRGFTDSVEENGAFFTLENTSARAEAEDDNAGAAVASDGGWWVDVQIQDEQMCAELGLRGEDFWSSISVIGEDGAGQLEENAEVRTSMPVRFQVMGDVKAAQLQVALRRKHVKHAQFQDIAYNATICLDQLEEHLTTDSVTNVWVALIAGSISPNCTPEQLSTFCLSKGRIADSSAPARVLIRVARTPMARQDGSVGSGSRQDKRVERKRESARKMEDTGGQDKQHERPSNTPTLELEEQLSNTKNELKILQQVMSFQERRIEGYEQAQQRASSEEESVKLLYSQLERMNSTVVLQKDTIATLDDKCRNQTAQLSSMVMKSQELETELQTRESVVHAARQSEVRLNDAQKDIAKLTAELQKTQAALEENERASVKHTALIESLQSSLKTKSQELETQNSQAAESAKKKQEENDMVIRDLNRQLLEASNAIETAVDEATVEATDATNELASMQIAFRDAQDQLQMYHQELIARNATIEELRAELMEEKAANQKKSAELDELLVAQRNMQAKLDSVSKTVDHYLPDASAQRENYRLTPDAVSTPQKGQSSRQNLRSQQGFRMAFDQSPISSLGASAGVSSLSAQSYVANPADDIDVLFAETVQRKARELQAIIMPNGTIKRTGKGKYGVGEHKIFLRAFHGPCGKELKVRRGGTFQLLDEWIDACAASAELDMDLDGHEGGSFNLPNPYAQLSE